MSVYTQLLDNFQVSTSAAVKRADLPVGLSESSAVMCASILYAWSTAEITCTICPLQSHLTLPTTLTAGGMQYEVLNMLCVPQLTSQVHCSAH